MAVCCKKVPLAETTWPAKYRRKGWDRRARKEFRRVARGGGAIARGAASETVAEPSRSIDLPHASESCSGGTLTMGTQVNAQPGRDPIAHFFPLFRESTSPISEIDPPMHIAVSQIVVEHLSDHNADREPIVHDRKVCPIALRRVTQSS